MAIQALKPGYRLNEFEIRRTVGAGGFGIVYEAWDHSLSRTVAIKEYMPSSLAARTVGVTVHVISEEHASVFSKGMRSFINEARTLAQFDHPALLRVYRFWEQNGTAYMAMPFYRGCTLKDLVRNHPELINEGWLKRVLSSLLDVLTFLHKHDCFHRDIAPDNIFILENGTPVLLDFGAARKMIGEEEDIQTIILKPGYAPVEQYAEDGSMPQGSWTDVYALAAVTYFAMIGRAPPSSVTRAVQDPLVPLEKQALPGYSAQFLRGLDLGLRVNPQSRPATAEDFRQALSVPRSDFYAQAATRKQTTPAASTKYIEEETSQEDTDKTRIFVYENNGGAVRPVETVVAPPTYEDLRPISPEVQKTINTSTKDSSLRTDYKSEPIIAAATESVGTKEPEVVSELMIQKKKSNPLPILKEHMAEPEPAITAATENVEKTIQEAVSESTTAAPALEELEPESAAIAETERDETISSEVASVHERKKIDLLQILKERRIPIAIPAGIVGVTLLAGVLALWPIADEPQENNIVESNAEALFDKTPEVTTFHLQDEQLVNSPALVDPIVTSTEQDTIVDLDEGAWQNALEAFNAYLQGFPNGRYVVLAKEKVAVAALEQSAIAPISTEQITSQQSDEMQNPVFEPDDEAWEEAAKIATPDAFSVYLQKFPNGKHTAIARRELEKERAIAINTQLPQAKEEQSEGVMELPVWLQIKPWGTVRVGGEDRGVSPPLKKLTLPIGTHKIEIENPSFETIEIEFVVKEGERNMLAVDF